MKQHTKVHTGEKPYNWVNCEQRVSKHESLVQQRRLYGTCGMEGSPSARAACELSGDKCKDQASKHVTKRHGAPYQCQVCQKMFTLHTSFIKHEQSHDMQAASPALHCSSGAALTRHARTHAGEKPYTCEQCGKGFKQQASVSRHKKTHVGEKPYKCNYCDKWFQEKEYVKQHERIHTGEKPYKCAICDETFMYRFAHLQHKKTHKRDTLFSLDTGKALPKHNIQASLTGLDNISLESPTGDASNPLLDVSLHLISQQPMVTVDRQTTHVQNVQPASQLSSLSAKECSNDTSAEPSGNIAERDLHCSTCNQVFATRGSLKCHYRTHTGERPYNCNVCEKSFNQLASLNRHKRIHTGEKPYKCHVCSKQFAVEDYLKEHSRIHTGEKPYRCPFCDDSFSNRATLIYHKKKHPEFHTMKVQEKMHECGCDEAEAEAALKGDGDKSKQTWADPPAKVACTYCDKVLSTKGSALRHERTHTGEKPLPCKYCHLTFGEYTQQKRHMISQHRDILGDQYCEKYIEQQKLKNQKQYVCHICGKELRTRQGLKIHTTTHEHSKQYKCEFCGKLFKNFYGCKLHEKCHRGEESHVCTYCGQRFVNKSRLASHERTHTGDKPYKCQYCEKAFCQQSALMIHHRMHTGERPFKCHYCDKRFVQNQDLIRHERLHRGEKPYSCSYCEMTFTLKGSKDKHEKIHMKSLSQSLSIPITMH